MRFRDTTICVICVILAAGLLIVAGLRLDYINAQRKEMKLVINEPLENAPPSLAFATIAMGAFRGLVVDILWLRADRLKEQGQFFDAKQLAEWITTLQPRFASVWEFQAWNMAYNISVTIPATEADQRWRWVKNGYELLRDRGIERNPKSIQLYRELARIFQHKIGGVADDAHKYYKLQLALAMEPLLGSEDNRYFADAGYFKALAEAPTDWQQVAQDANIAPLITALKAADRAFADRDGFVSSYLSLRQNASRFNPAALEAIDDFRDTQALKKFDIFARAYQLRNVWKLEPVLMQQLNRLYGPMNFADPNNRLPLDWRHPDTHAVYWAVKGLQTAGKEGFSREESKTDRIVVHSLQNLFRNGKIFIYDIPPKDRPRTHSYGIFLRPDLRMFSSYNQSLLAILEKYETLKPSTYRASKIGHRNMLKNAIISFYQTGHIRQARRIYNQLRQRYPRDEFEVPLVTFVRNRLYEELKNLSITDAREIIQMLLREAYFRYAMRDDEEAFGREKMAKEVYDTYQKEFAGEGIDRIMLPDFKLLRFLGLRDFYGDQQYPLNLRRNLIGRIKVERPELAEQMKQMEEKMLKQSK